MLIRAEQLREAGEGDRAALLLALEYLIPRGLGNSRATLMPNRPWVERWYFAYTGMVWDGTESSLKNARHASRESARWHAQQDSASPAAPLVPGALHMVTADVQIDMDSGAAAGGVAADAVMADSGYVAGRAYARYSHALLEAQRPQDPQIEWPDYFHIGVLQWDEATATEERILCCRCSAILFRSEAMSVRTASGPSWRGRNCCRAGQVWLSPLSPPSTYTALLHLNAHFLHLHCKALVSRA